MVGGDEMNVVNETEVHGHEMEIERESEGDTVSESESETESVDELDIANSYKDGAWEPVNLEPVNPDLAI